MGDPHPGVRTSTPTAIHAHCSLLYWQLFWGHGVPDLSSAWSCRPCCLQLLFALRPYSSPVFFRNSEKPVSSARQNGICNWKRGAAPSRRAREISSKRPTITGHDNPRERARQDIESTDVHCFSRALLVALFCTAFVLSRAFESAVRMASSTVLNLIGRIFQGFARTPVIR